MNASPAITASPAKLRDGSWGARVPNQTPTVGAVITIRTAGGKTWDAEVAKVIWSGADASIVATRPASARPAATRHSDPVARQAASATRRAGGRACRECGGHVQSFSDGRSAGLCHDCV